jgi:uncharacterized protein YbaR (Trm112 family)
MPVPKDLIEILRCPFCLGNLKYENDTFTCLNPECGINYGVIDGDIPNMLIDEAQRPCPKCGTQRDWDEEKDTIRCPKCGASLTVPRDRRV